MKILLVTLYGPVNIGNRLQHYALQSVLQNAGIHVDSAVYRRQRESRLLTFFKNIIKRIVFIWGSDRYGNMSIKKSHLDKKRCKSFKRFTEKTITSVVNIDFDDVFEADIQKKLEEYDFVITGSDQVWHHWYPNSKNELPYFYLKFVPHEKRISYAASFGFTSFDSNDIEIHRSGLRGLREISVREIEMVPMIEKLCERKACVVLDPTLLLNKSEWESIIKKPNFTVPSSYILLYFVGNKTDEYMNAIYKFRENLEKDSQKQIEIIDVYDPQYSDYYLTAPDEFLYLIENAECVFTDSFHGTVFSIIFNKNFLVFKRKEYGAEDMYGRLSSLLSQLEIVGHEYACNDFQCPDIPDYLKVNSRLDKVKLESLNWLYRCIGLDVYE